ncbi:hypothetical protein SAY87_016442 [Trapa incisa]|uniref:TATA element modulatory factor 1 TATA binding domain-containing protein n=1 Tax=Trapa incisa TaxID=236973 RepID=A0AAN7LGY7_9MYRT|nr:hypothetical protein SAY87_016442 [Trapa incisa]
MAWFGGRVSLGNFPDLAGAVNKISESVKNIEKNFDTALGLEEKTESHGEASGIWPSTETKSLFEPVMSFMGQKGGEVTAESATEFKDPEHPVKVRDNEAEIDESNFKNATPGKDENEALKVKGDDDMTEKYVGFDTNTVGNQEVKSEIPEAVPGVLHEISDIKLSDDSLGKEEESKSSEEQVEAVAAVPEEPNGSADVVEDSAKDTTLAEKSVENTLPAQLERGDIQAGGRVEPSDSTITVTTEVESADVFQNVNSNSASDNSLRKVLNDPDDIVKQVEVIPQTNDSELDVKQQHRKARSDDSDYPDTMQELEKVKMEMKMMETALQGAARQAQAKADEIAKLMNENEQLKVVVDDLKRKSSEAEIETLREEYHQRVATLERKLYALTKERDTLRREQSKKSDAAALLKEKDEIISQVMAEGEELSKKQAAQESTIRKLRTQIRELEEEKKGLTTKLQVEENKVESIRKDKAATEKLLQETIEKHQADISAQKEFYTSALQAAKEAEALAEARANSEARSELESRLKEAEEREVMLVQTLEELRQTLSRKEQQAVFREDRLRRDIEDLQKHYQESERRCEELISQVPDSTRPLLRQIEAIQETASRKAEAWSAVERSLNSRLQEAEARAAAAEERERSVNERLSQTLSRINVLEAQISCLRTEQTQLSRSLEKERQRAAENRQEYLAAKEEADTHEGRANQLEEEIRELKRQHKQELQESLVHRETLQQEIEREKAARLELERNSRVHSVASDSANHAVNNGNLTRRLASTGSLSSIEESYFLQASLDSSDSMSERKNLVGMNMSPYYVKSMTPSTFEAALRQKEGELASYTSRLASMESIRDSLAEELVKLTAQCEKLRSEASVVPSIRAELEALRRRHSAALELMGERDEELEELRADIDDLKEMYREQVSLLVNQIQTLGSSMGIAR